MNFQPLKKAVTFASVWGLSLLLSAILRIWGQQHPEPLQPEAMPVLSLLFVPTGVMACWLLWSSRGRGESE